MLPFPTWVERGFHFRFSIRSDQRAKRHVWRCPNLRGPTRRRSRSALLAPPIYLTTSRSSVSVPPRSTRKRKAGRSDSIRSMGVRTHLSAYLWGNTTCRRRGTVTHRSKSAHQRSHRTGLCRMLHPNFAEFPFPRTPVNKGKMKGRRPFYIKGRCFDLSASLGSRY